MKKLSLIVPCYNEERSLPLLYEEVISACNDLYERYSLDHELILVNDGSKDSTLSVIKALRSRDDKIRFISFSRNFGKEAAIYAGLKEACGDYAVVLDADLQHPPKNIITMYETLIKGSFDSVAYRRISRAGEPKFRSFCSSAFYKVINSISDTNIISGATEFRMMTRQMTDAVLSLCESSRFSKGIFAWVGFDTKWLEYENVPRAAGTTKWSFTALVRYSLQGIMGFSSFPLDLCLYLGLFLLVSGLIWLIVNIFLFSSSDLLLILSGITFLSGIQLTGIGILGQYLARTCTEVKKRPVFIIKERG